MKRSAAFDLYVKSDVIRGLFRRPVTEFQHHSIGNYLSVLNNDIPALNTSYLEAIIDIINKAEKIGTYATSSLPYEDCCTIFTPRHPLTRPRLDAVREGEARLGEGLETLIQAAVDGAEKVVVEDGRVLQDPGHPQEAEG